MNRNILDIGNIPAVVATARAQLQIPKYGQLFGLFLECTAAGGAALTDLQLATDIALIRVVADGEEIHSVSGRNLIIALNYLFAGYSNGNLFSVPAASGTLFVPFAMLNFPTAIEQEITGLGTGDIQSLFVEVTFGPAALTVTQVAVSIYCDRTQTAKNQFLSIATFPQTLVAGLNEIQQLPKEADVGVYFYQVVNTNAGAVVLSRAELIKNSAPEMQLPRNVARMNSPVHRRTSQIPCLGTGAGLTALDATFMDFNQSNTVDGYMLLGDAVDQRIRLTYVNAPGATDIVRWAIRGLQLKQGK